MLDVFFLSYNEPYADEHYEKLLEKAPHARRVHGVKGFVEAHRECARQSMTYNFYVVDADAILVPDFDFDFTPSKYNYWWEGIPQSECLCVWSSVNPINGLTYGYGGVKLIPKIPLLRKDKDAIDFSTGFGLPFKVFDRISNITAFNYDEFNTWRSAFRECTKLVTNLTNKELEESDDVDYEELQRARAITRRRLDTWCTVGGDEPFGEYALDGARRGRQFGQENIKNPAQLKLINDYEWMKNEFTRFFGDKVKP